MADQLHIRADPEIVQAFDELRNRLGWSSGRLLAWLLTLVGEVDRVDPSPPSRLILPSEGVGSVDEGEWEDY